MTGLQFSKTLAANSAAAERAHVAKLVAAYEVALRATGHEAARTFTTLTAAAWQPPPEGLVLTVAALKTISGRLNKQLAPIWKRVLADVAAQPLARIGIAWDVSHPLAAGLLDSAAARTSARIEAAAQLEIRKTIGDAYTQGMSVRETAAQIRTSVGEAAPWQADMLARTDLVSLSNGASLAAAKSAGIAFKTWVTAGDEKVRPEHADADGQTVPADGMFNIGGEDCDYPADPVLSDANAANCRCVCTYSDSLEEAKSLLAAGGAMMTNMIKPDLPTRLAAGTTLPAGVKPCSLNGTQGYTGGGICRLHDGTPAGKQRAIKQAQADANKNSRQALVAAASPIPFEGTAAIEGQISDDNSLTPRVLLPDALSWPEMPVPFMAQTVTAEGHDGAEVAGRIDSFGRKRGTGRMRSITTAGELTTPFGVDEVAPMIADKTLRYVSVDLGSSEWAIVNRSTFKEISESDLSQDDLMAGVYALGLTSAKIKALTLVPTQAIEGASVALTASADGKDATLTMPLDFVLGDMDALVASAAPVAPPAAWFQTPEPPGEMPLTITKDGRVYGHLAIWSSCHVGFLPGQCVPPPRSPSNYARFHTAELDSAEGTAVWAGKLMFSPSDGGHADRSLSPSKASAYYDRTGMAAAYLRAVDGAHGIWVAGALNPKLSDEQRVEMRRELRLNPPSGDWRVFDGQHDLICGLAVAVPGFPVSRAGAEITVVASAEGAVLDLNDAIIASSGFFDADPAALDALEHEGLLDGEAEAERRMRVLAARVGGLDALAELAG